MTDFAAHADLQQNIAQLLDYYGFELDGRSRDRLVADWLHRYPSHWLRPAVIEALYQGRYKAVSVEQLLNLWQRRGHPLCHFNFEFEHIICGKFTAVPDYAASSERSPCTNTSQAEKGSAHKAKPAEPHLQRDRTEAVAAPNKPSGKPTDKPTGNPSGNPTATMAQGESVISPFQHLSHTDASAEGQPGPREGVGHYPIHQFVPIAASSGFYSKLREVAHTPNSTDKSSTLHQETPSGYISDTN